MKKKIILLALSLMLIATGVSASSLNGDYKGNPIVVVKSNGKALETDEVPAMIYDGHTVVPISLLRQIGASVTWDPNTYSVDVKMPESTLSNVKGSTDSSVLMNAKIANVYKLTQDLSTNMKEYTNTLGLYFDGRIQNSDNPLSDKKVNDSLTLLINQYNFVSDKYNVLLKEFPNVNFTELLNAIKNNYTAIDDYKLATTNLLNWGYYRSIYDNANAQTAFNVYLNKSSSGFDLSLQAKMTSNNGYDQYILKIINQ